MLRASDEERGLGGEAVKTLKVDVTTIHDVDGSDLEDEIVERRNIWTFSGRNLHNRRDGPSQIEERVQLDRGIAPPVMRPGKDGETEFDDRRVERVDSIGFREIDVERVTGVQTARSVDQAVREIRVDAPVTSLVGVGQCRAGDAAAEAEVIETWLDGTQTGFDVAQTLTIGELGERHAQVLIPARESRRLVLPVIASNTLLKLEPRDMIHHLGEDGTAKLHAALCRSSSFCQENGRSPKISKTAPMAPMSFVV